MVPEGFGRAGGMVMGKELVLGVPGYTWTRTGRETTGR